MFSKSFIMNAEISGKRELLGNGIFDDEVNLGLFHVSIIIHSSELRPSS